MNADQERAAHHNSGSALVLAGPGTGKTSTLIERVRVLVNDRGVDPSRILITTFTKKASIELQERIADRIDQDAANRMTVGTFHSICLKVLRQWPGAGGLPRGFPIFQDGMKRRILRQQKESSGVDIDTALGWIDLWKEQGISPSRAREKHNQQNEAGIAADLYARYEDELDRQNAADFSRLIRLVNEAARSDRRVKTWFQGFDHALVDEVQDLNALQMTFVRELHGNGTCIWAVGDDDQAVYGFRGSDVNYILNFERHIADAVRYELRSVYRVPPSSLTGALAVVCGNSKRIEKDIRSEKGLDGEGVFIKGFDDEQKEAEYIRSTIKKAINGGENPAKMAVLFRTGSVAPVIERELRSAGIDLNMAGLQNTWNQREARLVRWGLEMVHDPQARHESDAKSAFDREMVETARQFAGYSPDKAAPPFARIVAQNVPQKAKADRAAQWASTAFDIARAAAQFREYDDFFAFADRVKEGKPVDPDNAVTLSTMHSAKGLEWQFVLVAGCENRLVPHATSNDPDEERRLFYVAATRTYQLLMLTYARKRLDRKNRVSPFLSVFHRGIVDFGGNVKWPDQKTDRKRQEPMGAGTDEIDQRNAVVEDDQRRHTYQADRQAPSQRRRKVTGTTSGR